MAHVPVMRERIVALLAPALRAPAAVVVDCTLGLGGHAAALLAELPDVRLVGIDRDAEALTRSTARLAAFADRTTFVHAVYDELPTILEGLGLPAVQGILMDLGVSSLQLDEAGRGFSYRNEAPLDMRMDPARGRSAADVVNTYDVRDLARVIGRYGEERFASRVAAAIVRARPIASTVQLAETVRAAIPAATRRTGGHPATRTFQALRIEVNGELDALARAVPAAVSALAVQGRLAVLSYHSLEDRIVKRTFAAGTTVDLPDELPVPAAEVVPELRALTRGAERPSAAEVEDNPRATSARLRAVERLRAAA
ncbi:MAG: 16S rRNA (cytosine(1402)-N(4))-methyltransferase RsmH [Mycobacteriales bacterium]